jgi:hypothetical protein
VWRALQLRSWPRRSFASQTSPKQRRTVAGFTVAGFTAAGFTAAVSTLDSPGFTAAVSTAAVVDSPGFTAAVSTAAVVDSPGFIAVHFTAVSPAGIMLTAMATGVTGTMAGTVDDTAGGGADPDWRGRIMIIRGGAIIRITATTTTASLTPAKPGIIAPIPQAITRM